MSFFAHHGMLSSSLAEQGVVPLIVFQWLCENADIEGVVRDVRPRRVAAELSVVDAGMFSEAAVTSALELLQRPDPNSKRKECEGRRIEVVATEGCAFRLVTWDYYQNEWSSERRRMKAAARQRRFKASRKDPNNAKATQGNAKATLDNATESESESQSKKEKTGRAQKRTGLSNEPLEKKPRKESSRDVALRSIVAIVERSRPGFTALVNWKALSKLYAEFGETGLATAASAILDWSAVEDVIPYLHGVCSKQLDRGSTRTRETRVSSATGANWG